MIATIYDSRVVAFTLACWPQAAEFFSKIVFFNQKMAQVLFQFIGHFVGFFGNFKYELSRSSISSDFSSDSILRRLYAETQAFTGFQIHWFIDQSERGISKSGPVDFFDKLRPCFFGCFLERLFPMISRV